MNDYQRKMVEAARDYIEAIRELIIRDKGEDTDDAEVFAVSVHMLAQADLNRNERNLKGD